MELNTYPVLSKELSISKVMTKTHDDLIIYNTKTGMKAYPNEYTYQFAKRCRGDKSLREIISELSRVSREPFEKIQETLSPLVKKMKENKMITWLQTPTTLRPPPCEINLYSRIENISFEITRMCNLRCKHCYSDSGTERDKKLTFEEIKKLIDDLASIGVFNIMLTGGEPLLHPNIFDIIEYIQLKPMSVMLFTNGTLITKEIVEMLKDTILSLAVSIDGAVPETHDRYRGVKGSFADTVRAINMAKAAGIKVRGNVSIHKGNLNEIVGIIELLKELRVDDYHMLPISFTGRSEPSDIFVTPQEYVKVLKKIKQYEKEHGELKKKYPYSPALTNCGIGVNSLAVRSNGVVVPCPQFPDEVSLGNVRKDSIADIWNNSVFLNKVRSINVFESSMCKMCTHARVCKGGCIADVYARTGILTSGDIYECAYFSVYNDYIPVEIGDQSVVSAEIR